METFKRKMTFIRVVIVTYYVKNLKEIVRYWFYFG